MYDFPLWLFFGFVFCLERMADFVAPVCSVSIGRFVLLFPLEVCGGS